MVALHVPVMLEEVLEALNLKDHGVYVDGTLGTAGHAEALLKSAPKSTLIGFDVDDEALKIAKERLQGYRMHLLKENFSNIKAAVAELGYKEVNGIIFDLGLSMLQLQSPGRGFSFLKDEPLDMRMDIKQELTAMKIVNTYSESELSKILWQYGEERFSRKIARSIVNIRRTMPIRTCRELSSIIERVIKRRGRIHPATRSFQALRIAVNRELEALTKGIDEGTQILSRGGRFCIVSYHSLEDRIVKNSYKKLASQRLLSIVTKKPIVPGREEVIRNPSARSAKLRVAERL